MTFTVEYEREDDGRWLAEVVELPGVLAYGQTSDEAIARAQALALRVLAGGSSMVTVLPSLSRSLLLRRESMVVSESQARSRGASSHRLEYQT